MASLILRIEVGQGRRLGPGKVALLEGIEQHGSIAAAGRAMGMSYRRAWTLVEEINLLFGTAAVERKTGGRRGGGASLTPFGQALVARFRAVESAAAAIADAHLDALREQAGTGRAPAP